MDNRTDPIEIIAGVREGDGKQRAFDVWVHKARKAGWTVTVESTAADQPGDECGIVDVEDLRYRILHAKRVRTLVAITPADEHAIAAIVRITTGDSRGISWVWEFTHAAWAEPIIDQG